MTLISGAATTWGWAPSSFRRVRVLCSESKLPCFWNEAGRHLQGTQSALARYCTNQPTLQVPWAGFKRVKPALDFAPLKSFCDSRKFEKILNVHRCLLLFYSCIACVLTLTSCRACRLVGVHMFGLKRNLCFTPTLLNRKKRTENRMIGTKGRRLRKGTGGLVCREKPTHCGLTHLQCRDNGSRKLISRKRRKNRLCAPKLWNLTVKLWI